MQSYADLTLAVLVLFEGIVALSGTMVPWGKTVLASPESSLYSWQISAAHTVCCFFFLLNCLRTLVHQPEILSSIRVV